jgi:putative mycofactocin binding protein MftB
MKLTNKARYKLAPGTQVREEDFGLLFYTMAGPHLYFLSSGDLLHCSFFQGTVTLDQWVEQHVDQNSVTDTRMSGLRSTLSRLKEKGVIFEC